MATDLIKSEKQLAASAQNRRQSRPLDALLSKTRAGGFEPRPYYGHTEDCLTFYFDNAESYARRVDELLTLFLALKNDELVGCEVKGVRRNLKRLGAFGISIKQGKMRLDLFFHLLAFLAKKPAQRERYLELSRRTQNLDLAFGDL